MKDPEFIFTYDDGILLIFENNKKELTLTIPYDGSIVYFSATESEYTKNGSISSSDSIPKWISWLSE